MNERAPSREKGQLKEKKYTESKRKEKKRKGNGSNSIKSPLMMRQKMEMG